MCLQNLKQTYMRLILISWRFKNMATVRNSLSLTCLKVLFFQLTMLIGLYMSCHSLSVDGRDTLHLGASLTGNHTLISRNGTFEMGFFSPTGTHKWYVGIWYVQSCDKTIVWVANRETPTGNKQGVLSLSREGHLGVFDAEGASVWSINLTTKASRGMLLDSGNFVLLDADNISETVWESFDHPTDTVLPGMKVGRRRKYNPWKNSLDPAPGPFTLQLDPSGLDQLVLLWNDSVQYYASGTWVGKSFSHQFLTQILTGGIKKLGNISWIKTDSDTYVSYTLTPAGLKELTHFVLEKDGQVKRYSMYNCNWRPIWIGPADQCEVYGICGGYATCDPNNIQFCSCVEGFKPRDIRAWDSGEWWSSGCVRRSPLQCSATNGTTDGFLRLSGMSLPDENAVSYMEGQTPQGCRAACLNNCSCTAFAFTTTALCRFWFGDLLNILHNSSDGESCFIRVAASDLRDPSSTRSRFHLLKIVIPSGTGLAVIFALLLALRAWWRYKSILKKDGEDDSTMFIRTFKYKELQIATRNFKHKLGRGGFGSVFKGTLRDHTLVAVKKMENTGEGEKQFRAEISTLGNMQHVNLVRLLGFCSEGAQRLLVYEYMSNGSLSSFLFSSQAEKETIVLDWKTRFKIALGTARALVYLHEECRDRIIHCDIKPENILLDDNFCPKVADFGLAKLVGRDFSRVLTTTRGTRGYLAPEWISGIAITPKADVYSFGMTLLEIISGRRNLDLNVEKSSRLFFPTWAATQIDKGNIMGVVDARIAEKADIEEVRRAAVVGRLCIEEDENARPSMAQVVVMLEGKTEANTPQVVSPEEAVVEEEGDTDGYESDSFFKIPAHW